MDNQRDPGSNKTTPQTQEPKQTRIQKNTEANKREGVRSKREMDGRKMY